MVKAQTVTGADITEVGSKATSSCDCIHDSAFSLLLETYRQFQNNLIQSDCRNRLSAAASLSDVTTRKKVIALARQERDLRLKRLTAQLVAFSAAYDHSCRHAEREFGVTSRAEVDMKGAARELRGFVVIAPGQMARKTPTRFKEHWKLAEQELMTLHWQQDRALRG